MELQGMGNSLLASDARLVDHIVGEVKSQGIFDKFRKECIADVDTKPAYQNLRTRVEGSVNSFLNKQTWRTDLNKNQLRETLRKHIHDAPYLEVGVERIVDQVVNPKVYSVFMPQIEDVVYKFLGIEKPRSQKNGACDLKDLLPKDLDPVSPESDANSLKDAFMESVDDFPKAAISDNEQKPCSSTLDEKIQNLDYPVKMELVIKKEEKMTEKNEDYELENNSLEKALLNSSFKSDETNKTEEEEEDSPVFEPIDMNLNESQMSNDSHLSGISELTSHRSRTPDFLAEFSRDNFDCSNQDSQLSKVSSNSRLSIVTDFGSSNHASTPLLDSKDDSKGANNELKSNKELELSKDNKFNFDVLKNKDNSKVSSSSRENSRDASDHKDRSRDETRSRSSRDKHDSSKSSRDRDRDSRRRRSSKSDKYSRSKSKDERDSQESQDSKDNFNKSRESKPREPEKKLDDLSKEVKDLKDLYKEKIRELREKKEMTEKEKLGTLNKESVKPNKDSKDKKDSTSSYSSRDKDENRRSHKSSSSSSSRSSSYHNQKNSNRSSESKDSRERISSSSTASNKRDDRHHTNGKSRSSSSSSKRDSKSDSRDRSSSSSSLRDKKRREEKKPSKPTDDHSSLRKISRDRRSSDRDGSNGPSSKQLHKNAGSSQATTGRFGPTGASLAMDDTGKERAAGGGGATSDGARDSPPRQRRDRAGSEGAARRLDPGATEICLPLKKRRLYSDDSSSGESPAKKSKPEIQTPPVGRRPDAFGMDTDVASVPDEERVQIVEIADEDYEQPYPDKEETVLSIEDTKNIIFNDEQTYPDKEEPVLTIEETKNIIFNDESIIPDTPAQSKLSEMEQSIRDSLHEMMSDHGISESENTLASNKLIPVIDSTSSLLETLTDESNNDLQLSLASCGHDLKKGTILRNELNEEDCDDNGLFEAMVNETRDSTKENVVQNFARSDKNNDADVFVKPDEKDFKKDEMSSTTKLDDDVEMKVMEACSNTNEDIEKLQTVEDESLEVDFKKSNNDIDESKKAESITENVNVLQQAMNEEEKIDINDSASDKKDSENTNCDISKTKLDDAQIEKLEKDIVTDSKKLDVDNEKPEEKLETNLSNNLEKFDTEIRNFTDNPEQNLTKQVDSDSDRKNTKQPVQSDINNVYQDEESVDEFNDDKLVIDEEFYDKGNDTDEKNIDSKIHISNAKKVIEKPFVVSTEFIDISALPVNSNDENLIQSGENQVDPIDNNQTDEDSTKSDIIFKEVCNNQESDENKEKATIDENSKNIVELTNEISQEQMKHQVIDDWSQLHEGDIEILHDESIDKTIIEDSIKEDKVSRSPSEMYGSIEKLSETADYENNEKLQVNEDDVNMESENNVVEDDNSKQDATNKLTDVCENENLEDNLTSLTNKESTSLINEESKSLINEKSTSLINVESTSLTNEESNNFITSKTELNVSKLIQVEKPINIEESSIIEKPLTPDKDFTVPRLTKVTSPIEEDCLYFTENNYEKYLDFKCFLDKLELSMNRSTVNEAEKAATEPSTRVTTPIQPPSKLSPSPQLVVASINNNDNSRKKAKIEKPAANETVVVKKRKVGRTKKPVRKQKESVQVLPIVKQQQQSDIQIQQQQQQLLSLSLPQPNQQPIEQQPQLQQQQQPSGTVVNGENVILPLNNEKDVAVEKNPAVKEDKGRNRSKHYYANDDLYKPRPKIASSSRRKRPLNNQA